MRPKWVNICGDTWEYLAGGERIAVFPQALGGAWYMRFVITGQSPLDAKDVDDAKKEALDRVARICEGIAHDIR